MSTFTKSVLAVLVLTLFLSSSQPALKSTQWVNLVGQYPVGQTDPFTNPVHRTCSLHVEPDESDYLVEVRTPGRVPIADDYSEAFDTFHTPLCLPFAPQNYDQYGHLVFAGELVPHPQSEWSLEEPRNYVIHVDRYANPSESGNYAGVILLVPGTGSYGGNYIRFAMTMAACYNYVVYTVDLPGHGRSHNHKRVRGPEEGAGPGSGVFVSAAVQDGYLEYERGIQQGWEELDSGAVDVDLSIHTIQEVGRRIAFREHFNLAQFQNEHDLNLGESGFDPWLGKTARQRTGVTLIGTSQGGEMAFWAADPRSTNRVATDCYRQIVYPFDSVVCHDIYGTAFTAPQPRMKILRSGFPGSLIGKALSGKDSLWANADWSKYYDGFSLFLRAADRWVRWRYQLDDYREVLRYGARYRELLPDYRLPMLVAIGQNDRLYPSDEEGREIVDKVFRAMNRGRAGESLWHLEFRTPSGTNGHQLLVHHTMQFAQMVDSWITYRGGNGPGTPFNYDTRCWDRIY